MRITGVVDPALVVSVFRRLRPIRLTGGGCSGSGAYRRADGDIPRQQFADAVDGMIGDAVEDFAEVGFGIEAVELGGFDEACRRRRRARRRRSEPANR